MSEADRISVRDLIDLHRDPELLEAAWTRQWIKFEVLANASIGFSSGATIERYVWTDCRACGFGRSVPDFLAEDLRRQDPNRRLHVGITPKGRQALAAMLPGPPAAKEAGPPESAMSRAPAEFLAFVNHAWNFWETANEGIRSTGLMRCPENIWNPGPERVDFVTRLSTIVRATLQPAQTRLLGVTPENHYRNVRERTDQVIELALEVVDRSVSSPKHGGTEWCESHGRLETAIHAAAGLEPAWSDQPLGRSLAEPLPPPRGRPKKTPAEREAEEQAVRACIAKLRREGEPIERITRDRVAALSKVCGGAVSDTPAWKALKAEKSQARAKDRRSDAVTDTTVEDAIERGDWDRVEAMQKAEAKRRPRTR